MSLKRPCSPSMRAFRSGRDSVEKSSKHRKVEALIEKGADIQVLSESDFSELMGVELPRLKEKAALLL